MTTYLPASTLPDKIFASAAASILTPIVLGSGVGLAISGKKTRETYLALRQPPLAPPTWVFGPAWTLLYGLMGYAAHRAWADLGGDLLLPDPAAARRRGAAVYAAQLALNLAWTPLFFGLRRPVAALADLAALLAANAYLAGLWWRAGSRAAACLLPYLAWLGFATYLCAGVGHLNGWDLRPKGGARTTGKATGKSE